MTAGNTPELLLRRATQLLQAGPLSEAIACHERLLAIRPDLSDSWYNLGYLQRRARRFEPALRSYQEALDRGVTRPEEAHLSRAAILAHHLGRFDAAAAELERALAIDPLFVPALLNLGNLLEDRGEREPAKLAYERALAADPTNILALSRLAGLTDVTGPNDPIVVRLQEAIAHPDASMADKADLGFALGQALDAAGAYDEAFAAYVAANHATRASFGPRPPQYDAEAHEELIDRVIRAFPRRVVRPLGQSVQAPVFICGMFRSGSTLAEQILAGHGDVTTGGELDLLPSLVLTRLQPYPQAAAEAPPQLLEELRAAYLEGLGGIHPGASFVTDKRPDNFLHIGLIKTLFPSAKIVHTVRNPLDNCLSIYFLHLHQSMSYALDLKGIAHWYRQYRRLMSHWRRLYPADIHDLDYDELVTEPERTVRELLEFLDLPWEEQCLSFQSVANAVKTASVWQVRQPLYRHASGRWRNYESHLLELQTALDEPEEHSLQER